MLLKCTSTYPATPENTNLRTIPHLRELFGCEVGLSDHTMGIGVAVAAVALRRDRDREALHAARADGGVDSAFSLEPDEMRSLVEESGRAARAVGEVTFGAAAPRTAVAPAPPFALRGRRHGGGEALTPANLRAIRPGDGLPPKHYDALMGRRVKRAVPRGTPVSWDLLGDA